MTTTVGQFASRLFVTVTMLAYVGVFQALMTIAARAGHAWTAKNDPDLRERIAKGLAPETWRSPPAAEWAWFLSSAAWLLSWFLVK